MLQIGLYRSRPELYVRIDARIEAMVAAGLVDETQQLLAKGFSAKLPGLSAIGYREMIDVLEGRISLEEAIVLMKRKTREYVRRQANWFKLNDPNIHWFDAGQTSAEFICGIYPFWPRLDGEKSFRGQRWRNPGLNITMQMFLLI